ncbi:uncharacterized protein LOC132757700 [Ruditapes philippinarum]|uniref:uncharacterized protein LOC132757700 n=1 Tax=Ruditapes philippinarum TaxID=129788 RepID=UPI00295B1517|nr:uncharacterized protein LOC132757700 [Ruditapes philippinarum]
MDTIETFKVAINKTIEKRFLDIIAEQVEYIDTIETFKVAINNTVDKHFLNITAEQVKYRDEVKDMLNSTESLVRTVFNNISKVDSEVLGLYERIDNIKEVNKTIERISSDLISVDQKFKKTRDMVDTLGEVGEGKVRLVGGSYQYEGRLEIWHDWSWGTICDDEFTKQSAQVACKMLQYPRLVTNYSILFPQTFNIFYIQDSQI